MIHDMLMKVASIAAVFLLWPIGLGACAVELMTGDQTFGKDVSEWPNQDMVHQG